MLKKLIGLFILISAISLVGCGGGGGSDNPIGPVYSSNETLILSLPEVAPTDVIGSIRHNTMPYKNVKISGKNAELISLVPVNPDPGEPNDGYYKVMLPSELLLDQNIELTYITADSIPVYINITGKVLDRIRNNAKNQTVSSYLEIENNPSSSKTVVSIIAADIPSIEAFALKNGDSSKIIEDSSANLLNSGTWDVNQIFSCALGRAGSAEVSESEKQAARDKKDPITTTVIFKIPEGYDPLRICEYDLMMDMYAQIPTAEIIQGKTICYEDEKGQEVEYIINDITGLKAIADQNKCVYIDTSLDRVRGNPVYIKFCEIPQSDAEKLTSARTKDLVKSALETITTKAQQQIDKDECKGSKLISNIP